MLDRTLGSQQSRLYHDWRVICPQRLYHLPRQSDQSRTCPISHHQSWINSRPRERHWPRGHRPNRSQNDSRRNRCASFIRTCERH